MGDREKTRESGIEAAEQLLTVLQEQQRRASKLLEMTIREREAVLDNDIGKLAEINANKVADLERFKRIARQSKREMGRVAAWIGIEPGPDTTLRQIIALLEEPLSTELDKARSMLKNTLLQLRHSNRTNRMLLNQCLELVSQSTMMLEQLFNPPAVYGKDGNSQNGIHEGALVSNVA